MGVNYNVMLLPGDGIGSEIMAEAEKVLGWVNVQGDIQIKTQSGLVGGASIDAHDTPLTDEVLVQCNDADMVLFGAIGGPKWDNDEYFSKRPELGLLRLRKGMGLFANLRPALVFDALAEASSLKTNLVAGLDLLIVRELTGGIYFGEPRGIEDLGDGQRRGINTQIYDTYEIRRIAEVAFDIARKRDSRVLSVDKANVMEAGKLWREEVIKLHGEGYGDIALDHMYVDNCAMQIVRAPKQFDVIVTDNLFGDILSDAAAMLTGSLGMLPSASLGAPGTPGLYEPVHGSAPDIAGEGKANPLAMILSLAMGLRYSLDQGALADKVEAAVQAVLASGIRTGDIMTEGCTQVSTSEMGNAVIKALG